jgi:hypothetical protein
MEYGDGVRVEYFEGHQCGPTILSIETQRSNTVSRGGMNVFLFALRSHCIVISCIPTFLYHFRAFQLQVTESSTQITLSQKGLY